MPGELLKQPVGEKSNLNREDIDVDIYVDDKDLFFMTCPSTSTIVCFNVILQ